VFGIHGVVAESNPFGFGLQAAAPAIWSAYRRMARNATSNLPSDLVHPKVLHGSPATLGGDGSFARLGSKIYRFC
jgi:hypothetical protein